MPHVYRECMQWLFFLFRRKFNPKSYFTFLVKPLTVKAGKNNGRGLLQIPVNDRVGTLGNLTLVIAKGSEK